MRPVSAPCVQCQVLRDEKRVMEFELEQRSEYLAELAKKNKLLLGAWLQHLNEEATKLNEANKIAEECGGGAVSNAMAPLCRFTGLAVRGLSATPQVDAAQAGAHAAGRHRFARFDRRRAGQHAVRPPLLCSRLGLAT